MPTTVDQDLPSKDISIIIPTYNRETKTLQRTVDSILSLAEVKAGKFSIEILIIDQNYPSLDLSIFDDQNHHIFYAKSYAIEDIKINEPYDDSKKIEILHFFGLNPSVTKAKNFALSRCRGEYIVFFDDDIKVHQNCLENYIYTVSYTHLTLPTNSLV
ncbi:glycosyltransferase family 2 protein [Synechococcus moorigangaii CMS01]|nr:glycosyltransferase family 2 protein [Synechococcus moorigangaii CMS01]